MEHTSWLPGTLVYLGAVVMAARNARVRDFRRDGVVLASLVFLLMYGFVISLVMHGLHRCPRG